ncbi:hypothetical protein J8L98_01120 [Pseudoalteromonas sp. MMG013]|uniref:hypothetical protein n=1 Tax=unclassified Pseudoalteromonas TaxID=194690 RepID=UPI001B388443|nr:MULTISPECIES: hypothetical protein [unclassified Pseudoalteromonas]MBQ4846850.1 hypothetical protein [Pseudoalteromonas sp. MMG005]MBQ4860289.1 hypothetical protein [Pseudoalteromonas sp. MMG013]
MKTVTVSNNQHTYQLKPVPKAPRENVTAPSSNPPNLVAQVRDSAEGIKLAQAFQEQSRSTIYDQPDFKSSLAISAYKEINNQSRREDVESLIGVNIYA